MQDIKKFDHGMFGSLEVVMAEGEPMFYGKDIATKLGYKNVRDALSKHVHEEDKGVVKRDTLGGGQTTTVINESGLYSLTLRSKLPSARKFQRWVTKEVLPSIRKNGGYISGQEEMDETELVARAFLVTQNLLKDREEKLTSANNLIQDKNTPVSLSKMYGKNNKIVQACNLWLEDEGFIEKVFKDGVRMGWELTKEGKALGYGSQVSDSSIFWTPAIMKHLPSTKKLLEFANDLGLINHSI